MLEILGYDFNRQGFFIEGFISPLMVPVGNPFFLCIGNYRICLGDPILGILGTSAHFRHFLYRPSE